MVSLVAMWLRVGLGRGGRLAALWALAVCVGLVGAVDASGQEEPPGGHRGHHPGQVGQGGAAAKAAKPAKAGMGGGPGGGMGGMMEKMGAPKPRDLYPRLMALPDLPWEERDRIEKQAHERMQAGAALWSQGLGSLADAAAGDDFAAMQKATATVREGLAQFESGLAAHRALAEGKAPRNVALRWFKREMHLLPPRAFADASFRIFGMTAFHAAIMLCLVLFSGAVLWMYAHKMRRASALLERLVSGGPAAGTSAPSPTAPRRAAAPAAPAAPAASAGRPVAAAAPEPAAAPAPKRSSGKYAGELRVSGVFDETLSVKTFRLESPGGGALGFSYLPGQFLMLTTRPSGKDVKRSYTISSSPTQARYCEITVKREDKGLVSSFLHRDARVGMALEVAAAHGRMTFTGEESDSIVLIGGGVGITPLMSVVRYLTDIGWGKDIFLLYSCRSLDEVIFRDELRYLEQRHANLHLVITLSRSESPVPGFHQGRLSKEMIAASVPDIASRRVHICGSPPLTKSAKTMLAELGVPAKQIKSEAFGGPKKGARKTAPKKAPALAAEPAEPVTPPSAATAMPPPPPASAPAAASASAAATAPSVTFQPSGRSGPLAADETVLDVADALEVEIDSSCRAGSCGSCLVKLRSGEVEMECEDGLDPDDKAAGMILACQARSSGDVTVET